MSIIIFFGMALMIFLAGCIVIGVTLYQWYKHYQINKKQT